VSSRRFDLRARCNRATIWVSETPINARPGSDGCVVGHHHQVAVLGKEVGTDRQAVAVDMGTITAGGLKTH